ncbi:hypothetical protein EDB80DRAFT_883491 [Ilyonectria destructans]|nr:hypothetical protein EDB80DRAFT_883491 [Ilyonectria destructans]
MATYRPAKTAFTKTGNSTQDCHTAKTTTTHSSTTVATKTTGTKPATTTKGGKGIETPEPTLPDMVSNCNKFYYIQSGESCDTIAKKYGITQTQFVIWNPKVGSACTGLWASTYACVAIIGSSTTPNGISTPTPMQME